MRTFRMGLLLVVLSLAGCRSSGAPDDPAFRSAVQSVVTEADAESLTRFYEARQFRPAWVEARDASERLREAVDLLCRSSAHGLNRAAYVSRSLADAVEHAYAGDHESDSIRVRRLAELDVEVSRSLMDLAADLISGRVDPRDLAGTWETPVHTVDPVEVVAQAALESDPDVIRQRITGAHEQYRRLLEALARYRAIAREGGFPAVEQGPSLSVGDSTRRVSDVVRRLAASGDLAASSTGDSGYVYTESVAEAVRSFQERHGLAVDGIVGESVVEAMNIPVEERLATIEINLERWRWLPAHLGARYLYVNVPAFELHAFENGEEVLTSRVVVGEEYDAQATPVFSDTMQYVVFNPYWNIPQSIADEEILPAARQNPSYLESNHYEIVTGWSENADVVPATPDNLERVADGTYRIRQRPGPHNALGRIKFMFPNEFSIYLHDTPEEHLFEQPQRAYSHGCIRVEKVIELAQYAFTGRTAAEIEQTIASREHQTEYLDDPVPVYILYWTSFVDDRGRIHFREDLYGHDETVREALDEQARRESAVSCSDLNRMLEDAS